MNAKRWRLQDIIDFEFFVRRDKQISPEDAHLRDRQISLDLQSLEQKAVNIQDRQRNAALIRAWVEKRRDDFHKFCRDNLPSLPLGRPAGSLQSFEHLDACTS